jgi:hypothetical protein
MAVKMSDIHAGERLGVEEKNKNINKIRKTDK